MRRAILEQNHDAKPNMLNNKKATCDEADCFYGVKSRPVDDSKKKAVSAMCHLTRM